MTENGKSSVHEEVALRVFVDRRCHRPNHRQLVGYAGDFGKHAADRDPAFAVWFELERARHHVTVFVELSPFDRDRHRLAVQILQFWFGIERIDL